MTRHTFIAHQRQAYAYAEAKAVAALFMEMRLGKTLVAIRWAQHRSPKGNKLVVAPPSVLYGWQEELEREGLRAAVLDGGSEAKEKKLAMGLAENVRWFMTNYEGLYRVQRGADAALPTYITTAPWDVVTLDESAEIRNPDTYKNEMCRRYLSRAANKMLLCGLPNPEGPLDFFEQMCFLYGRFLNATNWWEFRKQIYQPRDYDWVPTLPGLKMVRAAVHARAFCMTRKEAGIGNQKIYERRMVELPQKIAKVYRDVERTFAFAGQETMSVLVVHGWLSSITGGCREEAWHTAKIAELEKLLTGELKKDQAVVWFKYNSELVAVKEHLKKLKITCTHIIGATPLAERQARRLAFQAGKFRIMLMQLKCGKYGLDLSAADTAIYFSNSASYNERAQSEDRIEHPIKKRPLLIIDLLAKDTVDVDTRDALSDKRITSRSMLKRIAEGIKRRRASYAANHPVVH